MLIRLSCESRPEPLLLLLGKNCQVKTVLSVVRSHITNNKECALALVQNSDDTILDENSRLLNHYTESNVLKIRTISSSQSPVQNHVSPIHTRRREIDSAFCLGFANDVVWLNNVDCSELLVATNFSRVYRGTIDGGKAVAIKILKSEKAHCGQMEIAILNAVRSEHVVDFFGVYIDSDASPALVFEYASQGTVFSKLSDTACVVTIQDVLTWFRQVMKALRMLHCLSIVHRDVKTENLLLDAGGMIRLCDFGMAHYEWNAPIDSYVGTYHYMSPEVIEGGKFTSSADIYASAIVLWEMCNRFYTGKYTRPYKNIKTDICNGYQLMVLVVKKVLRPTMPDNISEELQCLLQEMWQESPVKRPNCCDVLKELER